METNEEPLTPNTHIIPPPVEPEALTRYLFKKTPFDGSHEIRTYVEKESPNEEVTYLERINTVWVMGEERDVWDVHTTGERYWVITHPTNLYSQRLFPSADYTLTFHIGLAVRIFSRHENRTDTTENNPLLSVWRKWTQAAEALDQADEAEDFQAVGMRCRECLISLVHQVSDPSMVPADHEPPKASDFVNWADLIANALASGSSATEVRGYLKSTSKSTWKLVSWLTHASNAVRSDAELAIEATHSVIITYSSVLERFNEGVPDRCPKCSSYKVTNRYVEIDEGEEQYISVCDGCGWNDLEYTEKSQ